MKAVILLCNSIELHFGLRRK